jgi:hypothetical protein
MSREDDEGLWDGTYVRACACLFPQGGRVVA